MLYAALNCFAHHTPAEKKTHYMPVFDEDDVLKAEIFKKQFESDLVFLG